MKYSEQLDLGARIRKQGVRILLLDLITQKKKKSRDQRFKTVGRSNYYSSSLSSSSSSSSNILTYLLDLRSKNLTPRLGGC